MSKRIYVSSENILFNDDGTAWFVTREHHPTLTPLCVYEVGDTFEIEVETNYFIEPSHHHVLAEVHKVSVDMVLLIVDPGEDVCGDAEHIAHWGDDRFMICSMSQVVTLPPAAAPGMWAIHLISQ